MTVDGFEECFATNHLAHFLLVKLLLPKLKDSAPSRVVLVSSSLHKSRGHGQVEPMLKLGSLDILRKDWRERPNGMLLYKNSKLANIMFACELQRRLAGTGVTAHSLSPGFIPNTGLSRNQGFLANVFMKHVMPWLPLKFVSTMEQGADCIEYVCTSPELDGKGGGYYAACREAAMSDEARDETRGTQLWNISEEAVAPFLK